MESFAIMRMRVAILLLSLGVALGVFAGGSYVVFFLQPDPQKSADAEHRKKDSPAEEEKTFGQKLASDPTAYFTLVLSFVTAGLVLVGAWQVGLFRRQLGLMEANLQDTKIMAEAAKANAEAAKDNVKASLEAAEATKRAERAYIALSHERGILFGESPTQINYAIQLVVKNWGRTPGTVEDVCLKAVILSGGEELPEQPDYSKMQTLQTAKTFLVPQADLHATEPLGSVSKAEFDALRTMTKRLFVYGYVQYTDKFGKRHHGRYGRMYEPRREGSGNNLVFITRGAYNDDIEV